MVGTVNVVVGISSRLVVGLRNLAMSCTRDTRFLGVGERARLQSTCDSIALRLKTPVTRRNIYEVPVYTTFRSTHVRTGTKYRTDERRPWQKHIGTAQQYLYHNEQKYCPTERIERVLQETSPLHVSHRRHRIWVIKRRGRHATNVMVASCEA